jgi:hypothetical protein
MTCADQRSRVRRSASSSHALTERMTLSLAGMPFGKSVRRRASRSVEPLPAELARLAGAVVRAPVRARRRRAALPVDEVVDEPARVAGVRLVAPGILWVWRRWAPSDAARVNVRPHSGQTNSVVFAVSIFVAVSVFAFSVFAFSVVLGRGILVAPWVGADTVTGIELRRLRMGSPALNDSSDRRGSTQGIGLRACVQNDDGSTATAPRVLAKLPGCPRQRVRR